MQFSLQIFILSMAENFLHPYLDDTYLLSMYVCMYVHVYVYHFSLQFVALCFSNSQNFYAMNDVFLFLHVFAKFLWMYFISVSSCLYIPSFMYLPPYIVATITFLPFRNETLHLMTRYLSNQNQDWLWGNLYIFKWIVVYVACHISYWSWCFNYSTNLICIEWMS